MPKMQRTIRTAIVLSLLLPSFAVAQDHAYTGLVLRLPSSARTLAMGNVGVVGRDDDVLFYNPAQLVTARGTSFSAERFSKFARGGTLSSVIRFNNGGIGIGATVSNYRSTPGVAFPADRLDMRGTSPATATSSNALAVGIGQVFKGTRLGITGKYFDEPGNIVHNSALVVDAGVARDFFGYSFGLAVQNIGPRFEVPQILNPQSSGGVAEFSIPAPGLPLSATFGAGRGLPVGPFDLAATTAVSWLRDGFVSPAGGAELGYSWLEGYNIIFRAGARRPVRGEGPVTAGAGFIMDRLAIDYAIETLSGGRAGHRIGLRIR
jgi:hypothetical protein